MTDQVAWTTRQLPGKKNNLREAKLRFGPFLSLCWLSWVLCVLRSCPFLLVIEVNLREAKLLDPFAFPCPQFSVCGMAFNEEDVAQCFLKNCHGPVAFHTPSEVQPGKLNDDCYIIAMEDAWELCETFQDFSVLFPKKSLIERSMRNILQFPKTIHFYLQGAGDISCNEASNRAFETLGDHYIFIKSVDFCGNFVINKQGHYRTLFRVTCDPNEVGQFKSLWLRQKDFDDMILPKDIIAKSKFLANCKSISGVDKVVIGGRNLCFRLNGDLDMVCIRILYNTSEAKEKVRELINPVLRESFSASPDRVQFRPSEHQYINTTQDSNVATTKCFFNITDLCEDSKNQLIAALAELEVLYYFVAVNRLVVMCDGATICQLRLLLLGSEISLPTGLKQGSIQICNYNTSNTDDHQAWIVSIGRIGHQTHYPAQIRLVTIHNDKRRIPIEEVKRDIAQQFNGEHFHFSWIKEEGEEVRCLCFDLPIAHIDSTPFTYGQGEKSIEVTHRGHTPQEFRADIVPTESETKRLHWERTMTSKHATERNRKSDVHAIPNNLSSRQRVLKFSTKSVQCSKVRHRVVLANEEAPWFFGNTNFGHDKSFLVVGSFSFPRHHELVKLQDYSFADETTLYGSNSAELFRSNRWRVVYLKLPGKREFTMARYTFRQNNWSFQTIDRVSICTFNPAFVCLYIPPMRTLSEVFQWDTDVSIVWDCFCYKHPEKGSQECKFFASKTQSSFKSGNFFPASPLVSNSQPKVNAPHSHFPGDSNVEVQRVDGPSSEVNATLLDPSSPNSLKGNDTESHREPCVQTIDECAVKLSTLLNGMEVDKEGANCSGDTDETIGVGRGDGKNSSHECKPQRIDHMLQGNAVGSQVKCAHRNPLQEGGCNLFDGPEDDSDLELLEDETDPLAFKNIDKVHDGQLKYNRCKDKIIKWRDTSFMQMSSDRAARLAVIYDNNFASTLCYAVVALRIIAYFNWQPKDLAKHCRNVALIAVARGWSINSNITIDGDKVESEDIAIAIASYNDATSFPLNVRGFPDQAIIASFDSLFDGFIKENGFSVYCHCSVCQASCCKNVCLFDAGFKVNGSNQIEIASIIDSMKPRFNFLPNQLQHEHNCCSKNGDDILWTAGKIGQVLVVNLSADTWSELPPANSNVDILGKKWIEQAERKTLVEHFCCTSFLVARGIHDCQHFLLLEYKQEGEYLLYDSLEGEKEQGDQSLRPEDKICALVFRPNDMCFFKDSVLRGKKLEKYETFIRSPVKKNHLKVKTTTRGNKDDIPTSLLKSTCSKLKKNRGPNRQSKQAGESHASNKRKSNAELPVPESFKKTKAVIEDMSTPKVFCKDVKNECLPIGVISLFDGIGTTLEVVKECLGAYPAVFIAVENDVILRQIVSEKHDLRKDGKWKKHASGMWSRYLCDVRNIVTAKLEFFGDVKSFGILKWLLIGGSPCQDLTFAGPYQGLLGFTGKRSGLVVHFYLVLWALQTLFGFVNVLYVLENAGSMLSEHRNFICRILGINPLTKSKVEELTICTQECVGIKRQRYFFRNFGSKVPIEPLFTPRFGKMKPLYDVFGVPLPIIPILRTQKHSSETFSRLSWTAYQPCALMWDHDFFGGTDRFSILCNMQPDGKVPAGIKCGVVPMRSSFVLLPGGLAQTRELGMMLLNRSFTFFTIPMSFSRLGFWTPMSFFAFLAWALFWATIKRLLTSSHQRTSEISAAIVFTQVLSKLPLVMSSK